MGRVIFASSSPLNRMELRQGDLLLAVPKKGRLYEKVIKLLEGIGLKFNRVARLDIAACIGMPVTLVFLPAADIPKYVGQGSIHMGITGKDMIAESKVQVTILQELGFGSCKLALQAPIKSNINSPSELAGGRIITSFPNLATEYFQNLAPDKHTSISCVSGSVEVACSLGLADAVVDLVETGSTMRAVGLEFIDVIMTTESVLISNPHLLGPSSNEKVVADKLEKRIKGFVVASKMSTVTYNIPKTLLPQAKVITPGNKAPTISPLEDPDWIAVSALVLKAKAMEIMDQLDTLGAEDILLTDLNNCRV